MKKFTNEIKVGTFALLCLAGFAYLIVSTGKLDFKKEGYFLSVVFNDAAGLEKKAPVMLNGLEIGKVEEVFTDYSDDQTRVVLKLWIDAKTKIRSNPTVSIKTLGLMGEKFVQITSHKGPTFVEPGTVLEGRPYLDMDALLEQAQTMTQEITTQLNTLIAQLNGTVAENKSSITQIVQNLESTTQNLDELSADVKAHPWKLLFKGKE